MANRLTGLLEDSQQVSMGNRLEGLIDPILPVVPDPEQEEKRIKDVVDFSYDSGVPLSIADIHWQWLTGESRTVGVPFPEPIEAKAPVDKRPEAEPTFAGQLIGGTIEVAAALTDLPRTILRQVGKLQPAGLTTEQAQEISAKAVEGIKSREVFAAAKAISERARRGKDFLLSKHPEWQADPPESIVDAFKNPSKFAKGLVRAVPLLTAAGFSMAAGAPQAAMAIIFTSEKAAAKESFIAKGATEEQADDASDVYGVVATALEGLQVRQGLKLLGSARDVVLHRAAQKIALGGARSLTKAAATTAVLEALEEMGQGTAQDVIGLVMLHQPIEGGAAGFVDRRALEALFAIALSGATTVAGVTVGEIERSFQENPPTPKETNAFSDALEAKREEIDQAIVEGDDKALSKIIQDAAVEALGQPEAAEKAAEAPVKAITPAEAAVEGIKASDAVERGRITLFRAERAGRGRTTDAIPGAIYFFDAREKAELWAGTQGTVIEREVDLSNANVQAVQEGNIRTEVLDSGEPFGVVIRSDPTGSDTIMEVLVFDKSLITQPPAKPEVTPKAKEPTKRLKPLTQEERTQLAERGFDEAAVKEISLADAEAILAEPPKPRRPRTAGFLGMPVELPEPEIVREKAEKIYQDFINRFASIENAVKKAKALGLKLEPGEDAGIRARSYLGLGRKVEVTLEKNTFKVTKQGQVVKTGEGLKPILDSYENSTQTAEPSRKKREKAFNDFLTATRAVEDLQRPAFEGAEKNIVSEEQVAEAQTQLDQLQQDWGDKGMAVFNEHAKRLYEYQKRVLHLLVDAGNISQDQFNKIVELNQHYIPFDRVMDEDFVGGVPVNKNRFTKARAPIGKIKGSEREIDDPMESVIKNTYKIMAAADRNAVAVSLAKLADTLPEKISPVRVKVVPVKVQAGETTPEQAEEATIFRASQFAPKGNVIEYFVDGKRKFIEVSGNLFDAMTGLNETSANILVKVFSAPAHWLRVGATITPEFIARNPIRDQWTALMQTSFGFTPFVDPAGAIADILKKTDIYQEWLASGGAYAGFVELNRPALQKAVKELRGQRSKLAKLNVITHAQNLSQLMEMATRLGAFKAARRKGKTGLEAGFESREASIDFARRGARMADVNRLMAFFNAGIQGLDKTIRTAINSPYQTALKGVAAITIPSLLLYLRNRKEDDYVELAQWKKDMFWNFKIGDNWWRIPKPFLFGQLFGSIPERFFEFADTKDKKAFDDLSKTIVDSISPVSGDPEAGLLFTALRPIIENATNRNFFLQRPIVPRSKQDVLPPEQFTRYTSETAKQLGVWLNYSPAKIENLVTGYFGGTGRYALQGTDILINGIRKEFGQKNVPKRPRQLADIPLVKGFVHRPPTGSVARSVNDFFESTDQILKGWNTVRLMQKDGRRTEARGLITQNPEILLHTTVTKARTRMSALTKQADAIVKRDISDDDKRKQLRNIDGQKLALAKQINEAILRSQNTGSE